MLELQDNIAKAQAATAGLRRKLVDSATREYLGVLDSVRNPGAGDFQAAEARANTILKQEILSAEAVALIHGGTRLEESDLALVALGFEAIARPVRIPGPALAEAKTLTLALAGAVGAVGGMFAGAPLMRLAFEMQDLGLVLGAPLGALLAVLIVHRLARIRLLARILPAFVRPRACAGLYAANTKRPCGRASSNGSTGRCRCWRCCASTGRVRPRPGPTATRPCARSVS
jgi:hypothetical protein